MILTNHQIAEKIKEIKPKKIAVAYIGKDYEEFINPSDLDFIIISPTQGSNPRAVNDLVKKIGWDRIYFHDSLHAKIYSSDSGAVIGSANLSRNGLSGEALIEFCTLIEDQEKLEEIEKFLSDLKLKCSHNEEEKKEKLELLKKTHIEFNKARNSIRNHANKYIKFDLQTQRVHVCWYIDYQLEHSDILQSEENYDLIKDYKQLNFAKEDEIEEGDYILQWKINNNNMPNKSASPSWLRVDRVIPEGVKCSDGYTKLVLQESPSEISPIEIDKQLFFETISQDKFKKLRRPESIGPWKTDINLSREFMQELMKNKNQSI